MCPKCSEFKKVTYICEFLKDILDFFLLIFFYFSKNAEFKTKAVLKQIS